MAYISAVELKDCSKSSSYLIFSIGNNSYGIENNYILNTFSVKALRRAYDTHDYIAGTINYNGNNIQVLDLRLRLGKEFKKFDSKTAIILISINDQLSGFIVDSIDEVIEIPDDKIHHTAKISSGINTRFIKGIGRVGRETMLLLDCQKLLKN